MNYFKVKHPAATCYAEVALATQVESLRNPATCPPKLSERRGKPRTPFIPVATCPQCYSVAGGATGLSGEEE